eukprot:gnl/TRDRNA2_/TRDRNA2_50199_c0_seq1.p1 gnl/TRDRNA2_/TRDRNA2_50199_c0~~gnl/TRDRNA2_/TRDRNA2_50199_c0_seq1.p1  ORF type:complete len:245 (+),score=67.96 gnl/TRDRNA2_/TRDRNA2_50199_c0_seq1:54-788(+)
MPVEDEELIRAFEAVIAEHPQGIDAGPKALLEAVKVCNAQCADVNIHKAKKIIQKIRQAKEKAQLMALESAKEAKLSGSCPGSHTMVRYITDHEGYACNSCHKAPGRNKCVPIGVAMWGCRICDWDVCEEKCYKHTPQGKQLSKVQQLNDVIDGLNKKLERAIAVSPDQVKLVKILALVRQEVISHEEKVQAAPHDQWSAGGEMSAEEALEQKDLFIKELSNIRIKIQQAINGGIKKEDSFIGA